MWRGTVEEGEGEGAHQAGKNASRSGENEAGSGENEAGSGAMHTFDAGDMQKAPPAQGKGLKKEG